MKISSLSCHLQSNNVVNRLNSTRLQAVMILYLEKNKKLLSALILSYLPKQLSRDEIDALIRAAILTSAAVSVSDVGKVMKIVAPCVKGLADGKAVHERVRELLS